MANPIQSTNNRTHHTKRQKLTTHQHHHHNNCLQQQQQPLIPGLPDHLSHLCLSLLPPSLLYSVCHSWRRLLYSPSFPPFLSLYTLSSSPHTDHNHSTSIHFFSFDPISSTWTPLPPPPHPPPLRLLLRHPSFISRQLPLQSISVSGHLILLAATNHNFSPAFSRPLLFNPLSNSWSVGPPLPTPRRWCAAGSTRGAVYVASGIGSHFSADVAKSAEKWDLLVNEWETVKGLKDGRFSRDAIDAVGWRGKVCMVNMKGDAAKEGVVYDVEKEEWEDMPVGMIKGWKGPVAAMDEEVMYSVEEGKGVLTKYDPKKDEWEKMMECDERLMGAHQIAAAAGRVCVIGGGSDGVVVVDVVATPLRIWVVETPPGFETLAVHILPRMMRPQFG